MRPATPRPPRQTRPAASTGVSAAMAGAVDLAAVKARSEAAQRAAAAPPAAPGAQSVIEVTEANFQTEVLDRSFQVPVLLDLWAEWCEPCKQLSPVLHRLALESAGQWILATIDIEANQRIAQMLQVQSIPTVFAVLSGQLVPGFQGALPEAQIREFLVALLDAARQAGLQTDDPAAAGPAAVEPYDERVIQAETALEAGDFELASQRYQAILTAEPANEQARLALGQVAFLGRLAVLPAEALAQAVTQPYDVTVQLQAADSELSHNDVDQCLERLISLVRRVRGEERDVVRQRLLEYFDLLGPDDPRVNPARRSLAAALF